MVTVYTLLGLTFIIFIHELGHFLVARWCGVKVYTFSIGFGPRIFTFYRDRRGTEYILSLIPLGGYVRMKGQEDLPSSSTQEKPGPPEYENDHFLAKKPWQKLWIILAGVKMNLISAYVFVVVAFMIGIPFSSNVIGGFLPHSLALNSPLRVGDEIVEVNGVKTDTMENIITAVALQDRVGETSIKALRREGEQVQVVEASLDLNSAAGLPQIGLIPKTEFAVANLPEDSELYRKGLREGYVMEEIITSSSSLYRGGVAWDYIKNNPGKVISFKYRDESGKIHLLKDVRIGEKSIPEKGFHISSRVQVVKGYPAEVAGIQDGDVIISINSNPIQYWEEILHGLQKVNQGEKIRIGVLRGEQELTFEVDPFFDNSRGTVILGVTDFVSPNSRGKEISFISPEMEKLVPGIRVGDELLNYIQEDNQVSVEVVREGNRVSFSYDQSQLGNKTVGHIFDYTVQGKVVRYSVGEAIPASFSLIKQEFSEVLGFFYLLIKGEMPLEVLGGPIAIFEVSYQVANIKGWSYFVLLLAKISISLVILNLLPIPVLDGGHACIILYEMIRRKPVPERALRFFQVVGIIFLLLLIVYVNYNDINRIMER